MVPSIRNKLGSLSKRDRFESEALGGRVASTAPLEITEPKSRNVQAKGSAVEAEDAGKVQQYQTAPRVARQHLASVSSPISPLVDRRLGDTEGERPRPDDHEPRAVPRFAVIVAAGARTTGAWAAAKQEKVLQKQATCW